MRIYDHQARLVASHKLSEAAELVRDAAAAISTVEDPDTENLCFAMMDAERRRNANTHSN